MQSWLSYLYSRNKMILLILEIIKINLRRSSSGKNYQYFERYLVAWVLVCIAGGIFLVKVVPNAATVLNDFSIYQVSILIAVCLLIMMYPIVIKIDFLHFLKSTKIPNLNCFYATNYC